jgi:hypothetical protein
MNPDQNRPIENLLEGLSQHARFLSREERKAELRQRGIDADRFLKKAHSLIAHHQKESRLAWMKIASEKSQRLAGNVPTFISWVGRSTDEILAAFKDLGTKVSSQHTLAFRNKTELTVEDMARILDDYERLRKADDKQEPPQNKS